MSGERPPRDASGAQILEIMAEAPRFNAWMYDTIAPWIGRRVLEVGAGIGNMSAEILRGGAEHLVLTDLDPFYRERLAARFAGNSRMRIDSLELPDASARERFAADRLDTVVALNVVEHIERDVEAVRTMGEVVGPGGRVVVLVPALQSLYGEMDRELGHYRRYGRRSLARVFALAGLRIERLFWFNRAGIAGWWFNGKVRGVKTIPVDQLRRFDVLVPIFRLERYLPLPFGQSLIAVGGLA
ncbi:MAG: class I SAM-dependent methyltransferase [Gemmatimonadales bacterium]